MRKLSQFFTGWLRQLRFYSPLSRLFTGIKTGGDDEPMMFI
jgi:hypothetical protein